MPFLTQILCADGVQSLPVARLVQNKQIRHLHFNHLSYFTWRCNLLSNQLCRFLSPAVGRSSMSGLIYFPGLYFLSIHRPHNLVPTRKGLRFVVTPSYTQMQDSCVCVCCQNSPVQIFHVSLYHYSSVSLPFVSTFFPSSASLQKLGIHISFPMP